jgi:hypothetical protein
MGAGTGLVEAGPGDLRQRLTTSCCQRLVSRRLGLPAVQAALEYGTCGSHCWHTGANPAPSWCYRSASEAKADFLFAWEGAATAGG